MEAVYSRLFDDNRNPKPDIDNVMTSPLITNAEVENS